MRVRSSLKAVFISISCSERVVDWVCLSVSGDDANRTVSGSKGEVILTLERLSSGGLSLSIIHSKDGSVMVKSMKIGQNWWLLTN